MNVMLNLEFKPAINADKGYFRALNRACYEEVVTRQFGPWDETLQNQSFEKKWPENNFRKAYVDGELVGAVWIDDGPEFIQLREIQIHPLHQGQGIGSKIAKLEKQYARRAGKPIRLRVLFENRAIGLYQRLGFQIIDKNEHQYIMLCT